MGEGVALGGHLGGDGVPVEALQLALVDDGEEEVAVGRGGPLGGHVGGGGGCLCVGEVDAGRRGAGAVVVGVEEG